MKNKMILGLYLLISMMLIFNLYLNQSDYSYVGYWTDKIVCWFWLTTTMIVIIHFRRQVSAQIYMSILVMLIFLSILPMALPFFMMVFAFSTIEDYQKFQLNDTYRIENTRHQPLSSQRVYIYKNQGIVEQNIVRPRINDIAKSVLDKSVDESIILIDNAELIEANDKEISIEYTINGKKAIVTHKFNAGYAH